MDNGLLMVNTGKGKGKTTAALGLAFRALGHNFPVCIIQFIKGSWHYGELTSAERFKDLLDFFVVGEGFTWESTDPDIDRKAAQAGWLLAKERIADKKYRLIILDEFTYVIKFGYLAEEEVLDTLRNRPASLNLLITGRDASPALLELADLVTEMRMVKHPYQSGVKAQAGVEY